MNQMVRKNKVKKSILQKIIVMKKNSPLSIIVSKDVMGFSPYFEKTLKTPDIFKTKIHKYLILLFRFGDHFKLTKNTYYFFLAIIYIKFA